MKNNDIKFNPKLEARKKYKHIFVPDCTHIVDIQFYEDGGEHLTNSQIDELVYVDANDSDSIDRCKDMFEEIRVALEVYASQASSLITPNNIPSDQNGQPQKVNAYWLSVTYQTHLQTIKIQEGDVSHVNEYNAFTDKRDAYRLAILLQEIFKSYGLKVKIEE